MIPISETETGVTFPVKVHPRAKKAAITGELGDALKVSLTAPPIEGRANDACIEFFAKLLKVPRSSDRDEKPSNQALQPTPSRFVSFLFHD